MNLTDSWAPDDCTTCTCGPNGKLLCQTQTCKTTCDNPKDVPGTCCPVCEGPDPPHSSTLLPWHLASVADDTVVAIPVVCPRLEHCPLRCEYGLARDDAGCFACRCAQLPRAPPPPPPHCQPLTEANCATHCAHGYGRDAESGCPVCVCANCPPLHACYKHCLYGFKRNQAGCPICQCLARGQDGEPTTTPVPALLGQSADAGCVDADGVSRESGEWWTEACRHCYCEKGLAFCRLHSPPFSP